MLQLLSRSNYNLTNMVNKAKEASLPLMEYVRALENKSSSTRGRYIQATLEQFGIKASIQESRGLRIKNIIVDFLSDSEEKRLLFSSHYDVVKSTPGANDNASGVSVLLGLCHKLKNTRIPVRIVFFGREEAWLRTPVLRLGLLGSLFYVFKTNLRDISAVYNLEFCGLGDFLVVWPIKGKDTQLPAFREVEKAASQLALPFKAAHVPWPLLSSDHLSFRLRGFSNAVTLSLLPQGHLPDLENILSKISLWKLLARKLPVLPEPLSSIHSYKDTSSELNEKSLRLMLSLLFELIHNHQRESI